MTRQLPMSWKTVNKVQLPRNTLDGIQHEWIMERWPVTGKLSVLINFEYGLELAIMKQVIRGSDKKLGIYKEVSKRVIRQLNRVNSENLFFESSK